MSGKAAILGKIRKSLSVAGNDSERTSAVQERINSAPVGTVPKRGQLGHEERIELFTRMAEQVQTTVERVKDRQDVPDKVAEYLRRQNLPTMLYAGADERISDLPWDKVPNLQLIVGICQDADSAAVTYADVGIAETGTIAVFSGAGTPTGNNFLPQSQIVVIDSQSVMSDYESVWRTVRDSFGKGRMPRTVNFITGPSRSADIEQTLLLGAHGPRTLHMIIVD